MTVFILPSWWEKSQTSWTLERQPDSLRKSTWPDREKDETTTQTQLRWGEHKTLVSFDEDLESDAPYQNTCSACNGRESMCFDTHTGKTEHNPLRRSWCRLRSWCSGQLYKGELTSVYGGGTWPLYHGQLPPFPPLNLFGQKGFNKQNLYQVDNHRCSWGYWLFFWVSRDDNVHLRW